MQQYIYINWDLGSHTYTMTVNVSNKYRLLALDSLKDWLKFNKRKVQAWSFDDSSFVTEPENFDTVRALINNIIKL